MKLLKKIAAVLLATGCVAVWGGVIVGLVYVICSIRLFSYLFIGMGLMVLIAGLSVIIYQMLERRNNGTNTTPK